MFRRRGLEAQGLHEEPLILCIEGPYRQCLGPRHQASHDPVMPGAVREDQQLVLGVKPHEVAAAPSVLTQAIPPLFHDKDALNEVRAELRVMEAPVIHNRDEREVFLKHPGEDPLTRGDRCPFVLDAVDRHPLYAAARRSALKDKAAQVLPFQLPHPPARPLERTPCMILLGARGDEPGSLGIAYQAEGLPGDAESAPYLRTDRAVLDKPPRLIGEPLIQLVPAVPADLLPEQAGADS